MQLDKLCVIASSKLNAWTAYPSKEGKSRHECEKVGIGVPKRAAPPNRWPKVQNK
jgi:hypothetical protein